VPAKGGRRLTGRESLPTWTTSFPYLQIRVKSAANVQVNSGNHVERGRGKKKEGSGGKRKETRSFCGERRKNFQRMGVIHREKSRASAPLSEEPHEGERRAGLNDRVSARLSWTNSLAQSAKPHKNNAEVFSACNRGRGPTGKSRPNGVA